MRPRPVAAIMLRHAYLHKRSLPRCMEIVFWPLMDLFVWGFLTLYVRELAQGGAVSFLLGAMIFWEILYRAQQSISLSITEEFWARNIINLFISPATPAEMVAAVCAIGVVKSLLTSCLLGVLAMPFYGFDILAVGWMIAPLYGALLIFGWAVGLVTMGLIFRYGRAAEGLIWGVPFLLQPFSAVFYPVTVLPEWLQYAALSLPSTWVFEGMRATLRGEASPEYLAWAFGLCIPWMLAAGLYFRRTLVKVRERGSLGRQVME
ncbi:ABC transporter permease [Desulfohalovibrio reitneri]|uniref:ABC transporter permease n=1 Tax=Desulfohalovibrio reitneri TaxID=1307759 RepID=UPI0004A76158|nr:ABC transporter permease [Desulfohalovibrio reitneri]